MSDFVHFMDINMNISTHSHTHTLHWKRERAGERARFLLSHRHPFAPWQGADTSCSDSISIFPLVDWWKRRREAKRGAESGEERRRKRRMSWKVAKIDRAMLRQGQGRRWGWGGKGGQAWEATSAASWSIYQSAREYLIIQDNSWRKSATCQRARAL